MDLMGGGDSWGQMMMVSCCLRLGWCWCGVAPTAITLLANIIFYFKHLSLTPTYSHTSHLTPHTT